MPRKQERDTGASLYKRIDLNLLRIFREIARAEGIGAAARHLNLQQPTVSIALKRLEEYVDYDLCLRTSRGIELTPAGQVMADLCEQLFEAVQSLPKDIAKTSGEVEGLLTIRTVSGVVSPELDETLDTMRRRHPRIRLRIDLPHAGLSSMPSPRGAPKCASRSTQPHARSFSTNRSCANTSKSIVPAPARFSVHALPGLRCWRQSASF